jgi:hypothetical protein
MILYLCLWLQLEERVVAEGKLKEDAVKKCDEVSD